MTQLFKTNIGRLRIIGFLEGISLLVLVFVAMPVKYVWGNPLLTQYLGPVHGAIFLLFLLNVFSVAIEQKWKFKTTTWKVIVACFVPFGTFYIDNTILRKVEGLIITA